jgi:asparaginyl-tRNA synthetase
MLFPLSDRHHFLGSEQLKGGKPTLRDRVSIAELFGGPAKGVAFIGRIIGVAGWVRTTREQKSMAFIELHDGTTHNSLQVIADAVIPGYKEMLEAKAHKTGASLFIIGEVVVSPAKGQAFEMKATEIVVLGGCDPDTYPLGKSASHGAEFLREIAHLRPRTRYIGSMSRIRNALAFATHKFFHERGYLYCHTPLITASDCEGAGEMFQVTTLLSHAEDKSANLKSLPAAEGGKIDYSLDFFKRPAFLAVSGQLNGETYACALSNIYTFGPTFRAENSNTTRHLAEFWMIEPEVAFADLQEDADLAEAYIKFTIKYAIDTVGGDIEFFEQQEEKDKADVAKKEAEAAKVAAAEAAAAKKKEKEEKKAAIKAKQAAAAAAAADGAAAPAAEPKPAEEKKTEEKKPQQQQAKKAAAAAPSASAADFRTKKLRERLINTLENPFKRLTYTEAITLLQDAVAKGHQFENTDIQWGMDLGSEHERYISEVVFQRPVILMNYPKDIKAFYMRLNDDGKTVAAMDILVPGIGELVGGSQREERPDVLEQRIKGVGLSPEDYSWYLDLRRFGTVPHAGFGLGFERLVRYVTGIENIRDVIPFPRWPGHADF